jgi:hypothetical protein
MARLSRFAPLVPVLLVGLLLGAVPSASAAPPNDDFAEAARLSGLPVAVEGSNEGATSEEGEPRHSWREQGEAAPQSVWWRWRAPSSGPVGVGTCSAGEAWPSVAVFTGDTVSSLTEVVAPSGYDPHCPEAAATDRVAFFARAGQEYVIGVDSFQGTRFGLRIAPSASVSMAVVGVRGERRVRMEYRAVAGEVDLPELSLDWDPSDESFLELPAQPYPPASLNLYAVNAAAPGPGCAKRGQSDVVKCVNARQYRAAGPLVLLGDRNDSVDLYYARPGTVVSGGRGDDFIMASGRLSGGPGDDEIATRQVTRSWIRGGPGDDSVSASSSKSVINPGSGIDRVSGRLVHSRDGEIDYISCGTGYVDALDVAECTHVRRRGVARALPDSEAVSPSSATTGEVNVYCPQDGPRTCVGVVTVSRGERTFLRRRFKITRDQDYSESAYLGFRTSRAELRAMRGRLRVTVRSRDRTGRWRTASGTYPFPPE